MQKTNRILLVSIFFLTLYSAASAQPPYPPGFIGRCDDNVHGQIFLLRADYTMTEYMKPLNTFQTLRDASGLTYLRLPSAVPMKGFFVDWNGSLVEINQSGWYNIGICVVNDPSLPQRPRANQVKYIPSDKKVQFSAIQTSIPQNVVNGQAFSSPALVNEQIARQCWNKSNGDQNNFIDCMAGNMFSDEKKKAYNCVKQHQDNKQQLAMCLASVNMGPNEQRALAQAQNCYNTYGDDFSQYPLCLASNNFDQTTARAVACYQQQAQSGDFSYWQAAICMSGPQLKLNPELIIAAECAMASGGEPMTFISCAGGRLTAREIDKCFTYGIGGDGCFGPNNDIIKAARQYGDFLDKTLGQNHPFSKVWNNGVHDISQGPGPNNDLVKFGKQVQNSINDINNGPGENNDVRKTVNTIFPGLW